MNVVIVVRDGRRQRTVLADALERVWRAGGRATVCVAPRGGAGRVVAACRAMGFPVALLARDPATLERDVETFRALAGGPLTRVFADGWTPDQISVGPMPGDLTFEPTSRYWDARGGDLDALDRAVAASAPCAAPEGSPTDGRPMSLQGIRALHITSVHRPRDVRIFHKEVRALGDAGAEARVMALDPPAARARRLAAGWRLVAAAREAGADVFHIHDPELLPAALWLKWRSRRPVIYDVHEYLGETTRTKRWLPRWLCTPLALVVERVERIAGRRLSGVVTANEDLAARFALAGANVVSVTNSPYARDFPPPSPPAGAGVLYVGGLAPRRGLDIMKPAFALVTVPEATLTLVGPGDPGPLPERVRHIGPVDHTGVRELLDRARVAWIPLQRHGNYDRAVPTKLVEAMAAGRPVVASDLPRMASIVRATGCGIVVPADDPVAHAAAVTRLLEDPALSARMGAAGRGAFVDGLAFEAQAAKLVAFYREVLR